MTPVFSAQALQLPMFPSGGQLAHGLRWDGITVPIQHAPPGVPRRVEGLMSTRRFLLVVVIITFTLAVVGPVLRGYGHPADQPKAKAPAPLPKADAMAKMMRKKLEHAQKVLEGLAMNDLKKIEDNASDLMTLSKLAEFRVLKTVEYDRHTNDFRRALDDMARGVKNKSIEAATLAYMDMTMSCVRCHTHVRETKITRK